MAYLPLDKYTRRKLTNFIVVHCAATKPEQDVGADEIRKWHLARGFSDIGYHYVIRRNGVRELGRPTWAVGAQVEGYNYESVGVCLVGGVNDEGQPADNFTTEQMITLGATIHGLLIEYPGAVIRGHHDMPAAPDATVEQILDHHLHCVEKACPSFDAIAWWAPAQAALDKKV